MSRRAARWWRPSTTRRPAQRARARRWHADKELNDTFDAGFDTGHQAGRKELREELADLGTYDSDEVLASFDVGYKCGQVDERKKWQDLDLIRQAKAADPERFAQLADALREGVDAARRLVREWQREDAGDLLDVADAAGVTPLAEVDPGQVVVEIEAWLRERGRGE